MKRPALRYYGGKWVLAPWIISQFPPHRVYVEPFGGGGSVLLRKPKSYAEVYNDLDKDVVNLFRCLRDQASSAELERRLRLTPFARVEFDDAYDEQCDDKIEEARKLITRSFMGFGSDGHNPERGKTGFRANSNRSGTTPAHDWANYPDQIKSFTERLSGVVIENRDAKEVMAQQDSLETLHFVDPPYVLETRGIKHGYRYEMTNADHAELLEFLKSLAGFVVLCGYENDIYKSLNWQRVTRSTFADGARERTEVLWLNPRCWECQAQSSFDMGAV